MAGAGANVVIFTEQGRPRKVEFHNGDGVATGTIDGLTNATVYAPPGSTPELTLTVALDQLHILPMAKQEPPPEPEPVGPVGDDSPTLQLSREEIQPHEKGKVGRR